MVKCDTELKLFHSMFKYDDLFNYFFVAPDLSCIVIVFVRDRTLEGRQWVFKIPHDNPWE